MKRVKEIMNDAWSLYRETTAADPAAANRATFSACLKFAWEREPARYAEKVRSEWNAMGAARQLDACRKMAFSAAGTYAGKTSGYVDFSRLDPEDLASDTWIILQGRIDTLEAIQTARNRKGQLPLPLGVLLHRAAAEAIRRAIRGADSAEIGGEAYETAARTMPDTSDPAESAAVRDALDSVRDPERRAVLEMVIQGLTVREIAAAMGKSKSAVQRMIDAIRLQLTARLTA